MNPDLGDGTGLRLDEKIAVSLALALGIPLVLLFFWFRGALPWAGQESDLPRDQDAVAQGAASAGSTPVPKSGKSPGLAGSPRGLEPANELPMAARAAGRGSVPGQTAARPGDGVAAPVPVLDAKAKRAAEAERTALEALQREHDRLREENEAMGKEVRELQEEFAGAKVLHAKLVRDSQTREQRLNDLIRTLQAELERCRTEGADFRSELERSKKEAEALRKQEAASKGVQLALDGEKKKSRDLEEALKRSQSEVEAAKARLDAAMAQAAMAQAKKPDGEMAPQAGQAATAALQAEVAELRKKLEEATKKPEKVPSSAPGKSEAEERIRALEAENQRLQTQIQAAGKKPRAPIRARVIQPQAPQDPVPAEVREPGDLWEGAVPLHQYLRQAAHDKVGIAERDAGAQTSQVGQLVARLKFQKGKYAVRQAEGSKLESVLSQQGDAGYYLVVGYASLPGCSQQNETLSRRRAEAVSAAVRKRLKAGGQVQSMYFGETDQFDSEREEENQVVEIWKVGS